MPDDRKLMIKALVFKYTDPHFSGGNLQQVWGADFIKNKGEGQIFLLHGGPGVGKTFVSLFGKPHSFLFVEPCNANDLFWH